MKKVSVVIPTRNRAHLLRFALKSVLAQNYKNLEIIVCDNYSKDQTREVVASFCNRDIKYVRTNKVLSMPDNWEFALGQASGDYITYVSDDSYLLPESVKIAQMELEKFRESVVVWRHCAYFSSEWFEFARRNILYIPKTTSQSLILDSKENLKKLFDLNEDVAYIIPQMLNSMCHRSVIEKVIKKQGRFFLPSSPDFSSAAATLINNPKYLLLDRVLYISGVTPASIGATSNFNFGESTKKFIEEFELGAEDVAFLGIPVFAAVLAKTLANVQQFYLDTCPPINKKKVLSGIADRLLKVESNGVNVNDYWRVLNKYLSQESIDLRLLVAQKKFLSKIKWLLVKKIRSSPVLENLEQLRNLRILRGENWNFSNIEEASRVFNTLKS